MQSQIDSPLLSEKYWGFSILQLGQGFFLPSLSKHFLQSSFPQSSCCHGSSTTSRQITQIRSSSGGAVKLYLVAVKQLKLLEAILYRQLLFTMTMHDLLEKPLFTMQTLFWERDCYNRSCTKKACKHESMHVCRHAMPTLTL